MPTFFKHENLVFPPSLPDYGTLRSTTKYDLMELLTGDDAFEAPSYFDAIAIDGTALVHLLPTTSIKTLIDEYADQVFLSYLVKQLDKCSRLDVVWDTYIADSIKASTREKRGQGIRRKVAGKNMVPTIWKCFLRDENNKLLSNKVAAFKYPESKEFFVTQGQSVLTNQNNV